MKKAPADRPVFYVDPQSMINLAKYDFHLLQGIHRDIYYFCSKHYDYKHDPRIHYKKLFTYNKKPGNLLKALSYTRSWLLILLHALVRRPAVVHIQWFRLPPFDLVMVRLLQHLARCKVVFTAHNMLPHQGREVKSARTFGKAYRRLDHIIVHSPDTKQQIIDTFGVDGSKISVIPHGLLPSGVNPSHYRTAAKKFDHQYAALRGKTVFSALGFHNHYKGTDLLARTWATTPQLRDSPHAVLLVAGQVNDPRLDLSPLDGIGNVVRHHRRLPDDEFLYLLRHTSVCLLPYREISQSGLLLTAIAEHIPVLVTDKGAMAEPFAVADIGWIISQADEEELRQALLRLVQHPDEIARVRAAHHEWARVCRHYSWPHISQKTQQLYDKLS